MADDAPVIAALEDRLCRQYDVALLDLDGVVYIGPQAVAERGDRAGAGARATACDWRSSPTTRPVHRRPSPST